MKSICRRIALVLAALAVASAPVLGQTDLLKGRDGQINVGLSLYADDPSGNQDWVREYDGREFDLWGIDSLSSYGYGGDFQYWLHAASLVPGDEDVSLGLGVRDELFLNVKTDAMLHRLARMPGIDPYLSPLGLNGGAFTDLTPDNALRLDRRVDSLGIKVTPGRGSVILRADWWQETENGLTQFNYRGRSSRQMESADFGVDRKTSQGAVGTDFRLGGNTSLSYSYEKNSFSDAGQPLTTGDRPSGVITPGIKTTSNVVKARSRLSDRLLFTGAHVDRKRTNQTTSLVDDARLQMKATNACLTFLASDNLTLFGRYRDYSVNNHFSPVLDDPLDPTSEVTNVALDRRETTLQVESDYTGIRKALVRLGYERRKTERGLTSDFPEDDDLAEAMESVTTSDIMRASFNYHPHWKLSLSGKFEDWNISKPAFRSSAAGRRRTGLSATYLSSERLVLYADYHLLHDSRDNPSGMDSKFTDTAVGAWYGLSDRLNLDVMYSSSKVDATSLWELSSTPPEDVPFTGRNKQLSAGLNLKIAPRTSVYGRFLKSDSDGRSLIGSLVPGDPTLPDGWTPLRVGENRWTIGFTRDVSAGNRVLVEYSLADWEDEIDANNDGRFNLWRVAWSTGF